MFLQQAGHIEGTLDSAAGRQRETHDILVVEQRVADFDLD